MVRVPPHRYVPINVHLNKRVKDQKVGEGTYAVVYRGSFTRFLMYSFSFFLRLSGRELATGRKIAIKKIKVGQFKDGLDMSAVREVKYLRELHHPNVIEVRYFFLRNTTRYSIDLTTHILSTKAPGRIFL